MTTKEKTNVVEGGGNLTKLQEHIRKGVGDIETFKNKRADINAKINEIRMGLEAEGIPRPALDMAMRYLNFDKDKQEGFDLAYSIVREAMGQPLQADLFEQGSKK